MEGVNIYRKFLIAFLVIVGILALVVFASENTSTGNKTYSGQNLTFNYPDTWTIDNYDDIYTPTGFGSVEEIGSIKELASEPHIPATLDSVAESIHNNTMGTYDVNNITIAGVNGIEFIPTGDNAHSQRIEVYFSKGDTLYDIYITSNNLDDDKQGFDMIINTMQIK